ncbi:MAG: hypothetical protein WDM92_06370 [Caulobacteraceae bacterium]
MTPHERVAATQATLDLWSGRQFAWGRADCWKLTASHLRRMGRNPRNARIGRYASLLGARRALKRLQFTDIAAMIDDLGLMRIAPAAATAGDLLALQGDVEIGTLAVALGNGRALAFWEDGVCRVVRPRAWLAAWRA